MPGDKGLMSMGMGVELGRGCFSSPKGIQALQTGWSGVPCPANFALSSDQSLKHTQHEKHVDR